MGSIPAASTFIHCMHPHSTLPRFTMLPEWSKGLHLRCTVFALAGSNPAHSSLTFPFFGLNAALRPLRFDAIQVFFKGPALWPFEPNHKEHLQCPHLEPPTTAPDVNHQGPPNGSVRKSVRTRFSPPLRLVLSTFLVQCQRSVSPPATARHDVCAPGRGF